MNKVTFVLCAMIFAGISIFAERPIRATQQSTSPASKLSYQREQSQADVKLGDAALKDHATREAIGDYKAAILADPDNRDAHRKFIQISIFSVELLQPPEKKTRRAKPRNNSLRNSNKRKSPKPKPGRNSLRRTG